MVESCKSQPRADVSNIRSCVISSQIRTEIPQRLFNAVWRLISVLIPLFQSHSQWAVLGTTYSPFWCSNWITGAKFLRYGMAMINKIAGVLGFSFLVWPFSRSEMGTENGFDPFRVCPAGTSISFKEWVKRVKEKGVLCVQLVSALKHM